MFDEKKRALKMLNESDLYTKSPRKSFILMAKYYKHIGLNKERCSDLILDWLKRQKCSIEFSDVVSDLEKAINNVYRKEYIFIHDINANFYESEIEYVNSLNSKGEKRVSLSLLYLSKIFGKEFYCYHLTLHRLTGISIRHIKRIIKKLNQSDFLDITSANYTKKIISDKDSKPLKRYSLPNTYKINIKEEGCIMFNFGDIENIDIVFEMLK